MTERETIESGAERDVLPVRYDLCSPVALKCLDDFAKDRQMFMRYRPLQGLLFDMPGSNSELLDYLFHFIAFENNENDGQILAYILEAYARTMHEGAAKYGERVWEKGIPEDNLRNHAIHHLVKLIGGDTSEPHLDHLIWNVLTIIHFREKEKGEGNG